MFRLLTAILCLPLFLAPSYAQLSLSDCWSIDFGRQVQSVTAFHDHRTERDNLLVMTKTEVNENEWKYYLNLVTDRNLVWTSDSIPFGRNATAIDFMEDGAYSIVYSTEDRVHIFSGENYSNHRSVPVRLRYAKIWGKAFPGVADRRLQVYASTSSYSSWDNGTTRGVNIDGSLAGISLLTGIPMGEPMDLGALAGGMVLDADGDSVGEFYGIARSFYRQELLIFPRNVITSGAENCIVTSPREILSEEEIGRGGSEYSEHIALIDTFNQAATIYYFNGRLRRLNLDDFSIIDTLQIEPADGNQMTPNSFSFFRIRDEGEVHRYLIHHAVGFPGYSQTHTDIYSIENEFTQVVKDSINDLNLNCVGDFDGDGIDEFMVIRGTSIIARQISSLSVPPPLSLFPQPLSLSSFPNPFNSSTTISYSLPRPGRYALSVVDISGREVARLSDGWREAGSYREVWDGNHLTSGEYLLRLHSSGDFVTKNVFLIK